MVDFGVYHFFLLVIPVFPVIGFEVYILKTTALRAYPSHSYGAGPSHSHDMGVDGFPDIYPKSYYQENWL